MKKYIIYTFLTVIVVGAITVLYLRNDTPALERDWVDYLKYQPSVTFHENVAILSTVRDWTYDEDDTIVERDWHNNYEVAISDVSDVWFMVDRFGKIPAIGHSYLTFSFASGDALSFSIEARREWGEDYSVWYGLLNQYELAYTWSTEREMLTRRVIKDNSNLYMYKLTITPAQAQTLLRSVLEATNDIAQTPQFYNTFTANCTNLLANIVNEKTTITLPYHLSWNFPGLSDTYLMKQDFIEVYEDDIQKTKEQASLQSVRNIIFEYKHQDHVLFSEAVRKGLASNYGK